MYSPCVDSHSIYKNGFIQLIFVSSDHDQEGFDAYFSEMTFPAFPFQDRQAKADISTRLQIRGIPSLVMLGPRVDGRGDRPIINPHLRSIIEHGDYLSDFPYHPKPYGDLNRTTENINNFKCLIVFHEAGDDEEQEDIQEALQMTAVALHEDRTLRFFWANSPTGMCKTVREALKLGPVRNEPLMVLLNISDGGVFYVSPPTEVTMDSVQDFIAYPGEARML
jgi:nucleoredoxin